MSKDQLKIQDPDGTIRWVSSIANIPDHVGNLIAERVIPESDRERTIERLKQSVAAAEARAAEARGAHIARAGKEDPLASFMFASPFRPGDKVQVSPDVVGVIERVTFDRFGPLPVFQVRWWSCGEVSSGMFHPDDLETAP
ncbi:MAG: hypothetical protein AAF675_21490 [Pseudomonadota bacterium]